MKVEKIINEFGIPEVFKYRNNAKELLEKQILSCLYESFDKPIEWWILRFESGKMYAWDSKIKDWKLLYEVRK